MLWVKQAFVSIAVGDLLGPVKFPEGTLVCLGETDEIIVIRKGCGELGLLLWLVDLFGNVGVGGVSFQLKFTFVRNRLLVFFLHFAFSLA